MGQSLMQRYQAQIAGLLSCYDRIVITGTLPQVCYPDGMTHYLHSHEIPIYDYPDFAKGLRDQMRERAPQGPAAARRASRPGAHPLGHGVLQLLPALAR